jgi:glucokinase-like ROK family protein
MDMLPSKATHRQTKLFNQRLVLKTIYDQGQISRAGVARLTKLTRVTVSEIVADLLDSGLVAEVGRSPSAGGKAAILLSVVADAYHLIGLDLANDELHGAILNLRGEICHAVSLPLQDKEGEAALSLVYALLDALIAKVERPLLGIGIGTPGLLDTTRGIVRRAVNLGWEDLPLGSLLEQRYKQPVYIANDSQVTALAEHIFGAGKSAASLAAIRIGRGIGAGIILNRQLFQGDGFGAGEIGHISISPTGERCRCGNVGCIETMGSTQAMTHRAQSLAPATPASLLNRLAPQPSDITFEHVLTAYRAGDEVALQVAQEAAQAVSFAIACLVGAVNVRCILLVGAAIALGPAWLETLRDETRKRALPLLTQETEIAYGELGENSVILGASALLLTEELGLSLVR